MLSPPLFWLFKRARRVVYPCSGFERTLVKLPPHFLESSFLSLTLDCHQFEILLSFKIISVLNGEGVRFSSF